MKQVPPARRTIRLFPDYGRAWPLWEDSTPTWDVGYTTSPDMYGLSTELTEALAGWNAFWEAHFDPLEGWDSAAHHDQWRDQGDAIGERLREEVADFADVSYEPWPIGGDLR